MLIVDLSWVSNSTPAAGTLQYNLYLKNSRRFAGQEVHESRNRAFGRNFTSMDDVQVLDQLDPAQSQCDKMTFAHLVRYR